MYLTIINNLKKSNVDTDSAVAFESPFNFIGEHSWGTSPRKAVVMDNADT